MFEDVFLQFANCKALEPVFPADNIDDKLYWLSSRNKRVLGQCQSQAFKVYYNEDDPEYYEDGKEWYIDRRYKIFLNPNCLLMDYDRESLIKSVFAHELCHTLKGCMNHGKDFHRWAKVIYDNLGYVIDTKADEDASNYFSSLVSHKYMLKCDKCGSVSYFDRMSDPIKNPGLYKHRACGGDYSSYKLNIDTGEYEKYKDSASKKSGALVFKCPDCSYEYVSPTMSAKAKQLLAGCLAGTVTCPKCDASLACFDKDGNQIDRFYGQDILGSSQVPTKTIRV